MSRRRRRAMKGVLTMDGLINALGALLWFDSADASGGTVPNSAALAPASTDGTLGNISLTTTNSPDGAQVMALNGTSSYIDVAYNATLANQPLHTVVALVRAASAGQGGFGYISAWESSFYRWRFQGALTSLGCADPHASGQYTDAVATAGLAAGTWTWVMKELDSTAGAGPTKRNRLFRAVASVMTEYSYSGQTTTTNAYLNPTGFLTFGNTRARGSAWAGEFRYLGIIPRLLTAGEKNLFVSSSGVGGN